MEEFGYEQMMQVFASELGDALNKLHGKKIGFTLITFDFTQDGQEEQQGVANYISNANRGDMIKFLRETLERLESKQDIPSSIGQTPQ